MHPVLRQTHAICFDVFDCFVCFGGFDGSDNVTELVVVSVGDWVIISGDGVALLLEKDQRNQREHAAAVHGRQRRRTERHLKREGGGFAIC